MSSQWYAVLLGNTPYQDEDGVWFNTLDGNLHLSPSGHKAVFSLQVDSVAAARSRLQSVGLSTGEMLDIIYTDASYEVLFKDPDDNLVIVEDRQA